MSVYFIQAGGEDGPIKIGYTAGDPYLRMRDLQCGAAERLSLLCVLEGESKVEEDLWHRFFRYARMEGEWFRPVVPLLAAIGVLDAPMLARLDTEADAAAA